MNAPALIARLTEIAARAAQAPHGTREAVYAAAAAELGVNRSTLLRKLKEVAVVPTRKRRSDSGQVALLADEAMKISAVLMESTRKNGKRLMSIEQAVDILRSNGEIRAERIDTVSGEVVKLSETAISRALRVHKLHPDQLLAPEPVTRMASKHPNHVWQIDASLCVLYYLAKDASKRDNGLQVMAHDVFYKNKPANVKRIENDTVWRYVITDHASGWVYVEYVTGGETGQNLSNVFINAIQKRDRDPAHGVPFMAMLDPGSANTGAVFKNLCKALSVHVQINTPGRPRAKGQVEQAQNLVERTFESGLKFIAVESLAELNAKAFKWMLWFNGTQVHSRHGMTRYAAWMKIMPDQLRFAPSVELCRELAVTAPEARTVSPTLTVSFKGHEYDVSALPGVLVGEKILVCRNPWRADSAQVVTVDADGRELFYVAERLQKGQFGFALDAVVIGESYRRHADTPAQTNAKSVELLLTGAATLEAAKAARKGKALPFDGQLDPYKPLEDNVAPSYLPRAGTASTVASPRVEEKPWSHTKAAMAMANRGVAMTPDLNRAIAQWYPDGVPESDLDALQSRLQARPNLRAVGN
jgi:hypothetical protein